MNGEKQSLFDKTWICDEESWNIFLKTNGINDRFTFQKEFYLTPSQLQNIEKQKLQAVNWRSTASVEGQKWFDSVFESFLSF